MNLEAAFKEHIQTNFPETLNHKLLIAVSGGADSMALLYLLASLSKNIAVAHCNFGLRGTESDLDENLVVNTCKQLNIPVFSKRFETEKYVKKHAVSLQMAARELRYEWFHQLCYDHPFQWMATAHHQDDNVETILMNILRGTGIAGLKGIPLQNGLIIRPLLFAHKKQLVAYLNMNNYAYRTDLSNHENKYTRNKIRNIILPLLSELNHNATQHIHQLSEHATFASGIIQEKMSQLRQQYLSIESSVITIEYETVSQLNFPKLYLYELISTYGFKSSQCEWIHKSFLANTSGTRFFSPTHELLIDRKKLMLSPKGLNPSLQNHIIIDKLPKQILSIGTLSYQFNMVPAASVSDYLPGHLYVNADHLSFPLSIRHWQNGDAFYPLGSSGKKKVSDFLIDRKISVVQKRSVCVLMDQSGFILALLDYQIDNRYKLDEHTQLVLHIYKKSET
jgi:tRNA(Ile)-lysidine synthase